MWQVLLITFVAVDAQSAPRSYNLIRISASGFMPFDADVLPYAVIQHIQSEQMQRNGRHLKWTQGNGARCAGCGTTTTKVQADVRNRPPQSPGRTSRSRSTSLGIPGDYIGKQVPYLQRQPSTNSMQLFQLYDDDGEYLLDLKFHDDKPAIPYGSAVPGADGGSANVDGVGADRSQKPNTALMLRPAMATHNPDKRVRHFWLPMN